MSRWCSSILVTLFLYWSWFYIMDSRRFSSSEELSTLLATIDDSLERVSALKRDQLLALCTSMAQALSHFRSSDFSAESSAVSPPVVLQIVVSETCT